MRFRDRFCKAGLCKEIPGFWLTPLVFIEPNNGVTYIFLGWGRLGLRIIIGNPPERMCDNHEPGY